MFDNLSFIIDNYSPSEFNRLVQKCNLNVIDHGFKYRADWYNLRINYFPDQKKIKVSNSLHKFYNATIENISSVNHTSFCYRQVQKSIAYIEEAFGRSSIEMRLEGLLEFGLNINTGTVKPMKLIDRFLSIVKNASNPFCTYYVSNGKPTGKFCSFTDYKVKAYDKGRQGNLFGQNILRFEIVSHGIGKTRNIFGKANPVLSDLLEISVWENCYSFLIMLYTQIRIHPSRTTNMQQYAKVLCYADSFIKSDYSKELKSSYQDNKRAHDDYKNASDSPFFIFKEQLGSEFKKLISS